MRKKICLEQFFENSEWNSFSDVSRKQIPQAWSENRKPGTFGSWNPGGSGREQQTSVKMHVTACDSNDNDCGGDNLMLAICIWIEDSVIVSFALVYEFRKLAIDARALMCNFTENYILLRLCLFSMLKGAGYLTRNSGCMGAQGKFSYFWLVYTFRFTCMNFLQPAHLGMAIKHPG